MLTWYEKIEYYHSNRFWTKEQVAKAVEFEKINVSEYYSITQDKTYLQQLVSEEKLTAEEYEQIVGEPYVE